MPQTDSKYSENGQWCKKLTFNIFNIPTAWRDEIRDIIS